ncbi:MAG TPA: glycine betaine ABC transporter substrate-binding protein [Candidatus Angelobacter sp.]|jgi:osmoprotectant transport system substrate-binding protein|nr:glycine betaine ABC transporter substrate-binding protein [Candidatus Angelobacter sp.]
MDRRSFLSALALLLSGCMPKSSALVVGSKNFTEQLVLGELLAQYLGRFTSLPIDKRFYLAGSYICHQALLAGRIDMYVEYTGTALVAILKEKPSSDHAAVFNTVKELYSRRFGLEVFPSLGFDNTFAMVMRGSDARRLRLKTLSDAAAVSSRLRLGVGYEFVERPDGYKGLAAKYNLKFAEAPRVMDLGLLYRALQNNQVDIVAGSNTDGLIAALDLVVLEDDRHYFPPYDAVPVVRRATLDRYPEITPALQRLSGRISAEDMRRMNYAVDGEKKDAAAVVKDFLARNTSLF